MDTRLNESEPNLKARRFRFSLTNLFLAVAIVALSLALYLTSQKLRRATSELVRLRNDTGHLTISDPQRIHVISVPVTRVYAWRWRVYLPSNRDYWIHTSRGQIPSEGLPAGRVTRNRTRVGRRLLSERQENPESVLDIAIERDNSGRFYLGITGPAGVKRMSIVDTGDDSSPWWEQGMLSTVVAGKNATESVSQGEPLILLRFRVFKPTDSSADDLREGLMVWLSE